MEERRAVLSTASSPALAGADRPIIHDPHADPPIPKIDVGRAVWLKERRSGIGGTDAAAIMGLSPWASPYQVYMDKTGQAPLRAETEAMWWGKALESIIARRYTEKTGRKVYELPEGLVMRHAEHDFLLGTPDRLCITERRGLEIKTASLYSAKDWGEVGTDEIPNAYLAQVVHYMAITGFDVWDVAVLLGGNDFRVYTVRRDPDLEAMILDRCIRFWNDHVIPRVPPPVDGSEATNKLLRGLWTKTTPLRVTATPEAIEHAEAYAKAKANIEAWEAEKRKHESALMAAIGDLEGLDATTFRVTWKHTNPIRKVDYKALVEELADRLDLDTASLEEIAARFTTEAPGPRRFMLTLKDGNA